MTARSGHCDNGGIKDGAVGGDSLLQVGGKRRDSTAARKRIADERRTAR
jgi:hypothetical protein